MTARASYSRDGTTKVVRDWTTLVPGDFVTVVDARALPHIGWVDDLTEDGAVVWLVQAHGRGRRMFFRDDGSQVMVEVPHPNA